MKKVKIVNVKELEGKWLVYTRSSKKLSFMPKPKETKGFLTVGMVFGGKVGGKTVEEWCLRIAKQKQEA